MIRIIVIFLASGLLLLPTGARADSTYIPSMADRMEPLWAPLFSGGIVFGLAVFAALKIWRAVKGARRR